MMENISYLILLSISFYLYFLLTKFVFKKFMNSKSKLEGVFWFIMLLLTLSFLFNHSDNTNNSNNYGGECDRCDDVEDDDDYEYDVDDNIDDDWDDGN